MTVAVRETGRTDECGERSLMTACRRWLVRTVSVLVLLPVLAGCALLGKDDEDEDIQAYVEPTPGQEVAVEEVWSSSVTGNPRKYLQHPSGFSVHGRDLYVGSYEEGGVPFFRNYYGRVIRVDVKDGDIIWRREIDDALIGGVGTDGTRVFAGTVEGDVIALDTADGSEVWRTALPASVASPLTVEDGRVIFVTLDNRTYALDAKEGTKLWVHSSVSENLVVMGAAKPTVAEGRVFVGYSSGEVFALNLEDGSRLWSDNMTVLGARTELDRVQDVDAPLVVSERRVFAVNHQGSLIAFHPPTGVRIWEREMSAVRQPLLDGDRLYVADIEGFITAVSAQDGIPLWRTRLSDALLSAPVMYGGHIMVFDSVGRHFAVDPTSGDVVGLSRLNDEVFADPLVAQESLFLWTNEGNLYRFK
ncbi:MAG: outer membrane protein assembly factor BamB [Magnetococcales bacterium]|nr:outer membrane protein assembly factor BamB [Magnetococcales bacterium]